MLQIIDSYNEELHNVIESVAADGKVLVPAAGWVPVAGLTREEVEERLNEACKPYFVQTDIKVKVGKPPVKELHELEFQAF